jgi:hypothetical protein
MASLNFIAVGPNNETAANPKKKPIVVPARPRPGVPLSVFSTYTIIFKLLSLNPLQ